MGDLIDKNFASFDPALEILRGSNAPLNYLLGNHDFAVGDEFLPYVHGKLGLISGYYSFEYKEWQFIILDGNEISLFAYPENSKKYQEALNLLKSLESAGNPHAQEFNGGISHQQLNWLENELNEATKIGKKVIICCHFPVLPDEGMHNLWNAKDVLDVINNYSCVKAYFNGHYHAGNYAFAHQKHFVNFRGMVETENENAFAIAKIYSEKIEIEGFGREPSRKLTIY